MKIMKKQSIYALMSAIALAGAVGFSSCSSDEKVTATPNPGYNQTEGTVPVQFLFNVGSYGGGASTRQSADATQAQNNLPAEKFRGIEGARILCFGQAADGQYVSSCLVPNGAIENDADHIKATRLFDMARVALPGSLGYDNNGNNPATTRVLEMTFPLGTNSMMFYGRAITEPEGDYKDIYGHLDEYNVENDLTKVTFALGKRLTTSQKTEFLHIQNLLAAILTCIMETNRGTSAVTAIQAPETGVDPYGWAIPAATGAGLKWRDYYLKFIENDPKSPIDENVPLTQLEIKLAKAYKEMTTIKETELRNGSGPALISTIKNLWGIVNSVRCAQPTGVSEALAKYMAQRIHTELDAYFEPTFEGTAKTEGGMPTSISFRSTSDVLLTKIEQDAYWPKGKGDNGKNIFPENYFSEITDANNDLSTFPANFELPQGSTHLKFCIYPEGDTDHRNQDKIPAGTPQYGFYYVQDYNSSAVDNGQFTVDDYYYPAELLYFGNSPIRVSDTPQEVGDYPQNTTDWTNESHAKWTGWVANGKVASTTRSVAMTNNINYGTALLEMTVGYASQSLKDNNHQVQKDDYGVADDQEPDNIIEATPTSFKLVGVLIGGQSPRIGWNMLPAMKSGERMGYIYDDKISINTIPITGTSSPNYTMVFDNYKIPANQEDPQNDVYIALEFQNNTGKDFFGKNNLITNGSNFYLIGKLSPNGKTAPNLPAYHALPPYGMTGTTTVPRVFIQDHKTMVNFKIGENSLKSAYLTVPDLRSSSVTLGLSVDMSWSNGLNFGDIELGGTGN